MGLFRATALAATGTLGYALAETQAFRLQTHRVPVAPGTPALRVLHLSDTHLREADTGRIKFLRSLRDRVGDVDLIVMTGDMIENDSGIDPLIDALSGLEARYGKAYVLGSHDYYQSRFKLPVKYLFKTEPRLDAGPADTGRMRAGLEAQGWLDLTNRTAMLETEQGRIRLAGVDDPYLKRHRTDHIERSSGDAAAIGLVHAPDIVTPWLLAGFDLVVAGHTHGGQLRAPFVGALVTNSSLPTALAAGLHRIGDGHLHVSPGLGTSHYVRLRFLCRPEVTILEFAPR